MLLLCFYFTYIFLISRGHVNEVVKLHCTEQNKMYANTERQSLWVDSVSLFFFFGLWNITKHHKVNLGHSKKLHLN